MTKKSGGRIARDQEKKRVAEFNTHNTAWTDIRAYYTESQNRLNQMSNTVLGFFQVKNIGRYLPADQHEYTKNIVVGFGSDLQSFQARLNALYNQHKDKEGMLDAKNDPSQYTFMVQLVSAYVDLRRDMAMILDPIYNQVMGVMTVIENNLVAVANQPVDPEAPAEEPTQEAQG